MAEHGTTPVASQRDGTLMAAQQDGTADRVLLLPSHELDLIGSDSELRPLGVETLAHDRGDVAEERHPSKKLMLACGKGLTL